MSGGVLNGAMLLGLLGILIPPIIHFLSRRREPEIPWGAMQFLDLAPRDRQSLRLTERLLMLARMVLLALVALALARPFWSRQGSAGTNATSLVSAPSLSPPRDVVLILDRSASMSRKEGGVSPHDQAIQWISHFLKQLRRNDAVALIIAGNRVESLVDPPSTIHPRVEEALKLFRPGQGASDLPAAVGQALQILERSERPGRDIIILSDGQRFAWRTEETSRWDLLRDIRNRLTPPPRIWSLNFGDGVKAQEESPPNGSLGSLTVSRPLAVPGAPIEVAATLRNTGNSPLTRMWELRIDHEPIEGSAQVAGPVPPGGETRLTAQVRFPEVGEHLLSIRLQGDDSIGWDNEASIPIEVTSELSVLLVDGEPSLEPLNGETDFVRAALAPTGDDRPLIRTQVIPPDRLNLDALKNQKVVVLANVERLNADQLAAINQHLNGGGGLLIAPGDQSDLTFFNALPWMPATLLADQKEKGLDAQGQREVVHPDPASFKGTMMEPFARGERPALASADLFGAYQLTPASNASVLARLNTGNPWVVERRQGTARVLLLANALDAEGGTLPVNADFVPLLHECVLHLAKREEPHVLQPGTPWELELPSSISADPDLKNLDLIEVPPSSGRTSGFVPISRTEGVARIRYEQTHESGLYRLRLPSPPGGFAHALVEMDEREADLASLSPAETRTLAERTSIQFEASPSDLPLHLLQAESGGRVETWRPLILLALANLCLEVYLTRRLARTQGGGALNGT